MEMFLKVSGGVLVAVILVLAVGKNWKEAGILLTLCACCMVLTAAAAYLEPVLALLRSLQQQTGLDSDLLQALLKIVGISLIAETAGLICADSGNAGLGKAVQILAAAVVLWLSVPLLQGLLELVTQILGGI